MAQLEEDPPQQIALAEQEFNNHGQQKINDECDQCGRELATRDLLYLHGYEHMPVHGLQDLVNRHREHIMAHGNTYNLAIGGEDHYCRSFNYPLQVNVPVTSNMLGSYLLEIRRELGVTFRCRVGVSRVLQHKGPLHNAPLKFYRTTHDGLAEVNLGNDPNLQEGNPGGARRRMVPVNDQIVDGDLVNPLHPYTVTNLHSIYETAVSMEADIMTEMLNDRPNSEWQLVCPTNIRIYCYLVDFAGGFHIRGASLPHHIRLKRAIVDAVPPGESGRNACALYAIARHFADQRER